ncbi:MAG: hypothetical protein P8Y70_01055 [Candidatus Lokiarchaeota archaeon]
MIQGILTFKFILNQKDSGEIDPEFKPIQLQFTNKEYDEDNFTDLIVENDIYGTFYQQTTGIINMKREFSNYFSGKLKETPYQVMSYYKQLSSGNQYLAMAIFENDDEIELFERLLNDMGKRLDRIFEKLAQAENTRQLADITNLNIRLKNELKYTIFQVERLSNLDKLQKVALIFNSEERLKVLELLREHPISKKELKRELEKISSGPNIDILLTPFLELNLIRRDWIQGEKDAETGIIKNQGEYLFLVKDITFTRVPNERLISHLKDTKNELYPIYRKEVLNYFSTYDPFDQSLTQTRKLASLLLNPDVYDFYLLMKNNHYPKDKIPKIFSEFAVTEVLLDNLKELNVITEIEDKTKRRWIVLLTEIKPLIVFPEFLLPKIREVFAAGGEGDGKINYEVAKKAYDLLELTYPEKVEF